MAKTEDLLKRIKELEQENSQLKHTESWNDFGAAFNELKTENHNQLWYEFLVNSKGVILWTKFNTVYQVAFIDDFDEVLFESVLSESSRSIFLQTFDLLKNKTIQQSTCLLGFDKMPFDGNYFAQIFTSADCDDELIIRAYSSNAIEQTFNEYSKIHSIINHAQQLTNFGFWRYDADADTIYFTDYLLKSLDLPRRNKFVQNASELMNRIHPDDIESVSKSFADLKKKGTSISKVIRFFLQDGSIKFLEIKADRTSAGNDKIVINGSAVDITERHISHSKLMQNDRLMRNIAKNSADTFIVFEVEKDKSNTIVDYKYYMVNTVFELLFGIAHETIRGYSFAKTQPEIFNKLSSVMSVTYASQEAFENRFYFEELDRYYDILIYTPQEKFITTIWRDVSLHTSTENQLREDVTKYQSLFEASADAIVMFDFDSGKIVEANNEAVNLFGMKSTELVDHSMFELVKEHELLRSKMATQQSGVFNCRCKRSDAEFVNTEMSLVSIFVLDQKVAVANIRNSEERFNENEKLIRNNKFFRKIYENFSDPIVLVENGIILMASDKAASLFNLTEETIEGVSISDLLITGTTSKDELAELNRLINDKLPESVTYAWNYLALSNLPKVLTLFVNEIDEYLNQKLFIIKDETEVYNSIRALQQKNKFNNKIINESGLAVWEWYIDSNQVKFLRGWEKLIGYNENELPKKLEEFEKYMHPSEVNKTFNNLTEFLTGKIGKFDFTFQLKCKNGTYKWVSTLGVVEVDEKNEPFKFIGISHDYTKNKLREADLQKVNAELKSTMNTVKVGYWEIDLVSMLFTGSKEAFDILDLPQNSQTTLKHVEETILPADQEFFMSQFGNHASASMQQATFRIKRKDEKISYISSIITVADNKDGSLNKYKGVFQDVTFIAENILQNKSIESTSEINSIDLPIAVLTPSSFLMVTERFCKLVGYSMHELVDNYTDIHQLLGKDFIETFDVYLSKLESYHNQVSNINVELVTKYGKVRNVNIQGSKFQWKNHNAFFIIFKDQTKDVYEHEIVRKELNIYKHVSSNATTGFLLLNIEGLIIYHNERVNQLFEYESNELNGNNFLNLFSGDYRIKLHDEIENVVDTQKNSQIEIVAVSKLDYELWMQLDIVYSELEEGNIFIFVRDVNQYKQSYLDEKQHAEILTSMVEASSNGVALFDHNLNLVISNETFASLFESNFDRLNKFINGLGKRYVEVAELLDDFRKGEIASVQIVHTDTNGVALLVKLHVIVAANEKYLMVIAVDQSDNENKLINLSREMNKFKLVFDHSPFGNCLINKDRIIINHNLGLLKMLGHEAIDIEGVKLDQFINTSDLIDLRTRFNQLLTGLTEMIEMQISVRDIHRLPIQANVHMEAIPTEDGSVEYVLVTLVDISDKLKLQKYLLTKERVNTINHIGNRIAHRFNNYLMSIYGNSYSLFHNAESEEDKVRAQKIISSVSKVSNLTRNLLGFSESNRNIQIEFELNALLLKILETVDSNSNKKIKFQSKFESPVRYIKGDPDMLHTALLNIVQNAAEALENTTKPEITIDTGIVFIDKDQRLDDGELIKEGEYLRVRISDNAGKIEDIDYEKLFDPFYTTKDVIMNAGLGLTSAKSILQRHNGGIKVNVTPRIETNFYVYLPILPISLNPEQIAESEILINKGTVNILVIDDEELVRNVTSELLVKLGYNVYAYGSGNEAVKFFGENANNIQLVLLDVYMPEISGVNVLEKLKEINPKAKVILISGFNPNEEITELIEKQNCSFIQKPISIDKLSFAISSVLKK